MFENQSGIKLHEAAKISYVTIQELKSGGTKMPRYETICKILNAVPKLNARWLLLGEKPMFIEEEMDAGIVEEPALEYMKRSSLYNYPILVDEVEELRKTVKELRGVVEEMQNRIKSMNNKTEKKA